MVSERVNQYSQLYSSQLGDGTLLNAQALLQLQTLATNEANVLAYNDTYLLTAAIATATLLWLFWRLLRVKLAARKLQKLAA
jgi:hypothetical protein